jgi:UDP-GlcNAc3NAcA epimerase
MCSSSCVCRNLVRSHLRLPKEVSLKTVATIVGARPQFIKAAPLSLALHNSGRVAEVLVHTGQHYDKTLSEVFFGELGIPPASFNLGIGSGSHGEQTGRMIEALERVLIKIDPHLVLVYGDTNSTLAAAIAASKLHIPIAHVEAGLRSFNRRMPEEINRIVCDQLADFLFTPTETATANLLREGIAAEKIYQVGDVMYDAAILYASQIKDEKGRLAHLTGGDQAYILATIHRAENTDSQERLSAILSGFANVAKHIPIVFPVHPRTQKCIHSLGGGSFPPGIRFIPPVGYLDMLVLERNAAAIATDSGGVQKEAYFHRIPCVTLRTETEWVELVTTGWNVLVSPVDANGISQVLLEAAGRKGTEVSLYGDGMSAKLIVDVLAS